MSQGGAARKWLSDQPAPTEKYDLLVHPSRIRDVELTLAQKNWKDEPVNEGAEPETFHIGPATKWELENHGRYGRVDPDSWWGHCNGWASYVLNENEPTRAVRVRLDGSQVVECRADEAGCVRFELGDINALGAELYWSDAARMLGRRCEQQSSEFEFDEAGRISAIECRDGNAGSFHLIAANMLGVMERPFILDLTADFQVWNYPAFRYQVLRSEELSLERALERVGAENGTTEWIYNPDATRFIEVETRMWIVEDAVPPTTEPTGHLVERYSTRETYQYILELDDAGQIVGGEWLGRSKTFHPDFLWYSFSNSAYGWDDDRWDRDNPELKYSIFKQILTLAQTAPEPPPGGEDVEVFVQADLQIPDANLEGISSRLEVAQDIVPDQVELRVEIRHSYRGDLVVELVRDGQSFLLHNKSGGSQDDLRASFPLPSLAGAPASGTWTLRVVDTARADIGVLERWGLILKTDGGDGGGGERVSREYASNDSTVAIPDADPNGVSSLIEITDDLRIETLSVELHITHTYIGDLEITLSNGTATQTLHAREGGSADDIHRSFDTMAFRNASARGPWTLHVVDHAGADVGTIDRWKISITGTTP